MAESFSMELRPEDVTTVPFPAPSRQAVGMVNGSRIDVTCVNFADKIMVTICQEGRLSHWMHVPLESADPSFIEHRPAQGEDGSELLPLPHLTAVTLLGARDIEVDTLGQLYAAQIASAIATKDPQERRLLVLGLGMTHTRPEPEAFLQVLNLVLDCL